MKRQKNQYLEAIILSDEKLTKILVSTILKFKSLKVLKTHCKSLEISCNGLVWLFTWFAFIYLFNKRNLYEIQINVLIGLILDIILIAVLKSICRRRRPAVPNDMFVLGPDKYSFPSGHASRASLVVGIFICLYPVSKLLWMPLIAWCFSVCLSRIIIQRHYILDVFAGIIIGCIETYLLNLIWINENTSISIINYILNEQYYSDDE